MASFLGDLMIVAAADLADKDASINVKGPARVGDGTEGLGKRAGMFVLQDNGSSDYNLAVSLGSAATDGWLIFGRESTVTPA